MRQLLAQVVRKLCSRDMSEAPGSSKIDRCTDTVSKVVSDQGRSEKLVAVLTVVVLQELHEWPVEP